MLRFFIQFVTVLLLFFFSTFFAWYEGSTILENPWEWKYSTPFSQLLNGEVHSASDISQLDYFMYAAKFQPTFPVIMVTSSIYLLILIGYYSFKKRYKWFAYYLFILGGGLFFFSYIIYDSTTLDKIYFIICLLYSVVCLKTATISYFRIFNRSTNEITN
ncbi:YjdJ family protein [Viridibacillus arvi]|uniref:YjdJ family protein n=1 Tax=Viridibacillus arvi TaxID=263475 RepID=UPI00187B8F3D|nr:YjdJ family protein [Viridibacillus sp. JNUCC-6]QOV12143.1 YjdJ family protein [Viridibacillus sp. JNUCC-6]